MSDKTYCMKHYRQTFPDKGCDMCEQQARIDGLEVENALRWVPVSERLPRSNVLVIVGGGIAYCLGNGVDVTWYTITGFDRPGKPIQWEVTHWMPLPSLPEASDEH